MPVILLANSFSELLPPNGLPWLALCPRGLTFAPASTLFCFLWLLVQFAGGQLAEGKGGQAGYLFSLPTSVLIAVSLVHSFFQPSEQLSPATMHSVSSPLYLNPRHSNHFPLYPVSGDIQFLFCFLYPIYLYNAFLSSRHPFESLALILFSTGN